MNHVGSNAFSMYTQRLAGNSLKVHGRTFFTNKLEKVFDVRRKLLYDCLGTATWVATTGDNWSSPHRKKYFGETVHWKNEQTLARFSACLAIRRLTGSTTYLVLGKLIESIHQEFNIQDKVVMMTTDSGTNFLKAAKEFGRHSGAPEFDEENTDDHFDHVEFLPISEILDARPEPSSLPRGQLPISLPPHSKCGCHIFNLVCTTDTEKITDQTYKRVSDSVENKIRLLCNEQSYSDNTSDFIRKTLGGLFVKKNDTRWNSGYDSKYRVNQFLTQKREELKIVMTELKIHSSNKLSVRFFPNT